MQQLPTFEIVNSQLKFQTAPIQTVRIQDGPINNPTETLYQFYTETVMGILSRSKLAFFLENGAGVRRSGRFLRNQKADYSRKFTAFPMATKSIPYSLRVSLKRPESADIDCNLQANIYRESACRLLRVRAIRAINVGKQMNKHLNATHSMSACMHVCTNRGVDPTISVAERKATQCSRRDGKHCLDSTCQ